MKAFLSILTLTITPSVWADDFYESSSRTLVCAYHKTYISTHTGISCVSKASIERDQLQVEVLKLQLQELKDKAKEKALAESEAVIKKNKALKKLGK